MNDDAKNTDINDFAKTETEESTSVADIEENSQEDNQEKEIQSSTEKNSYPLMEMKKGRQDPSQGRNWYAIHTYSGYEDTVDRSLRQRIETMNMQDKIFDIIVPKETEIILRKGKPVQRKKCIFPGYVLVEMIVTDDSWYIVRNTPNVTGFVGAGTTPVPVTPEEFGLVKSKMGTEEPKFKADFKQGDIVKIIDGPFATFEGVVDTVNEEKGKLKILVTIFDRETPVELAFNQVKKK